MKAKLFLILCLCSLPIDIWANLDIVRESFIIWSLYREYSLIDGQREHRTDHYFFGRDTTIGAYSYGEVFWREDGDVKNEVSAGYALREDSDRVYVYDYASQKEYVLFDFSMNENDILTVDWIKETEGHKNPVFRVLAVGDTVIYNSPWHYHYLKVYDTVHQITDMWLSKVGSASHGIAWHRDFESSLDTFETVLCVEGGTIYRNQAIPLCYIQKSEPKYVSCTKKLILVESPQLNSSLPDCCVEVIAIKLGELTPILRYPNTWWTFKDEVIRIQGVDYRVGDSVEVEGYIFERRDIGGNLYSELILEGDAPPVVSIEKRQKAELKLFPNPAKETITLRATGCNLQKVEILDVNGRVLHAATVNGTESFNYNVSQMPSGIYLARVKTSCGVLTEKFSVR